MGGGAIRVAAKAGLGAFSGSHNPVAAAVRQATRSTVAVVSSAKLEEAKMVAGKIESPASPIGLQTPWDLEDWEMASGDNLFMEPIEPLPRVVFDAVPTIEEAKDAASELTTVIEKAYLSPNAPGLAGSWVSSHKPDLALSSNSEYETKTCVGNEAAITPAAPKHAIQAFRLLHESTAAQTVVASIASDQKVWNAVMQNEELVKFLEAHRTGIAYPEMNQSVTVEELLDDDESRNPQSPMSSEKSRDSEESGPGKQFMCYVVDIKERITTSIIEMMNTLSDTIQNLFGGAAKGDDSSAHSNGIPEATIATSIMTVVVMVIMVVVLKRA